MGKVCAGSCFFQGIFLPLALGQTEQNMVLKRGQLTFGACAFLCASKPPHPSGAITIANTMDVSCQQSPQKEVLHEESQNYRILFW